MQKCLRAVGIFGLVGADGVAAAMAVAVASVIWSSIFAFLALAAIDLAMTHAGD